mgnify:CR=1 FL=1
MKLTLQDHIDDFREAIGDDNYSESKIIRYLNKAQLDIARKLNIQIPFKRTLSTVAYQEEYTLPSNLRKILHVRCENKTLSFYTKKQVEQLIEQERNTTGGTNYYWRFGNKLGLYYIPDDDAETTTLDGTLNATATSFDAAYTADFPDRGVVIIDSEVIYYTNLTHTGTTKTTFEGLSRGQEGTKATTHSDGATVTWRDIEIFGYAYPARFINKPGQGSVSVTSGGNIEVGTHIYKMTFYSTSLGIESLSYTIGSLTTTSGNQKANLTSLAVSTNEDIDYKRIYRTTESGNIYYFVKEITNATTSTTDDAADSTISSNDRLAEPSSELPEEWHEIITWGALVRYFEDMEEISRATYWRSKIIQELPEAIWEETDKNISHYRQLPLPA